METICINFAETQRFEPIFLDYIAQKPALQPFYGLSPEIEHFEQQVKNKSAVFGTAQRRVLYEALCKQYTHTHNKPQIALELLLKDNTFTLTTGHQLNIFTGPLYFHYKIMTVIKAAKMLREKYPQYNFLPVYWMASEDHDAEEISSFRLFGKKYTWQSQQQGAVGRFAPQSLEQVLKQVPEMDNIFTKAYTQAGTLAKATRQIVNELYAAEGLLVVDGDDKMLKKSFAPVMQAELTKQVSFEAMNKTSEKLAAIDYKIQVNPREINLFYLDDNLRERIVQEVENEEVIYKVLHTNLQWTEKEMLDLLEKEPQKFSPNVVLRPVYQEYILPNVSYTGGPGELAYWLQLKEVFEKNKVLFPILLPRNHALYIDKQNQAQLKAKLFDKGLAFTDIFLPFEELKKLYLAQVLQNPVTLAPELEVMQNTLDTMTQKLNSTDKSLEKYSQAQGKSIKKIVLHLEKKLQKAQERRFEADLRQLEALQARLCPNGGLQERTDNFLSFSLNNPNFLQQISEVLNPFVFKFHVLQA
jgi:bacillithiol synthase